MSGKVFHTVISSPQEQEGDCSCEGCQLRRTLLHAMNESAVLRDPEQPVILASPGAYDLLKELPEHYKDARVIPFLPDFCFMAWGKENKQILFYEVNATFTVGEWRALIAAACAYYNTMMKAIANGDAQIEVRKPIIGKAGRA